MKSLCSTPNWLEQLLNFYGTTICDPTYPYTPMVVCATWVPRNHKLALHILLRIGGRKCYFLPLSLILDFSVPLRDSIQIVSIKELETLGEEGDTNREHDRHAPMVNNHLIDFSFPCTYEALTFVIVNEAKK